MRLLREHLSGRTSIGLRTGLSLAMILVLCTALAVVAFGARSAAERTIVPSILAKAESVGRATAALIETALAADIPLDRLAGVQAHFLKLVNDNDEIAEMQLVRDGRVLFEVGKVDGDDWPQVRVPVHGPDGAQAAVLVVMADPGVLSRQVMAVLVDVAFIGIVALLMALELGALVVGVGGVTVLDAIDGRLRDLARGRLTRHPPAGAAARDLVGPLDRQMDALAARQEFALTEAERRGDEAQVETLKRLESETGVGEMHVVGNRAAAMVRPALFLFMLAEELSRPFLPRYTQALAAPGVPFSIDFAVSLPIVVFMAVVALGQIPFGAFSEWLGRRTGFVIGAGIAACGYLLAGLAGTYWVFLAARVISALGYSLVFVSAQGHVVDRSAPSERSEGLAVFVGAIMVAALCGPPIGGVIDDRLGGNIAFLVSAGLAVIALALAAWSLPKPERRAVGQGLALSDLKAALTAPRLAPLLFGCAFPAKFILAALCFYLIPVELQRAGYSAAAVGRLQMIYPVIMVLAVPVFASVADRLSARAAFVATGGLLAGAGALLVVFGSSPLILALVLMMLGIGQSMSIAPQSALVADSARHVPGGRSAGVLGLFRLVERSGNAAGPAAAGLLLGSVGFVTSMMSIGAIVVVGAAAFILSGRVPARRGPAAAAPKEARVP